MMVVKVTGNVMSSVKRSFLAVRHVGFLLTSAAKLAGPAVLRSAVFEKVIQGPPPLQLHNVLVFFSNLPSEVRPWIGGLCISSISLGNRVCFHPPHSLFSPPLPPTQE